MQKPFQNRFILWGSDKNFKKCKINKGQTRWFNDGVKYELQPEIKYFNHRTKVWKNVKGLSRVWRPVFLEWEKIKHNDAKKRLKWIEGKWAKIRFLKVLVQKWGRPREERFSRAWFLWVTYSSMNNSLIRRKIMRHMRRNTSLSIYLLCTTQIFSICSTKLFSSGSTFKMA